MVIIKFHIGFSVKLRIFSKNKIPARSDACQSKTPKESSETKIHLPKNRVSPKNCQRETRTKMGPRTNHKLPKHYKCEKKLFRVAVIIIGMKRTDWQVHADVNAFMTWWLRWRTNDVGETCDDDDNDHDNDEGAVNSFCSFLSWVSICFHSSECSTRTKGRWESGRGPWSSGTRWSALRESNMTLLVTVNSNYC